MTSVAKIFIDGEAGTTGLQIRARLETRSDLRLLKIPEDRRKDVAARAELLNEADLVILCLPDEAAKEAVALIENPAVRVIDASTAHRVAPGWVYGFPEFLEGQEARIAAATRVANPGCYPTGALALVRPLIDAGLLPADTPVTVNAVSGYSGGGKKLIEAYEQADGPERITAAHRLYGLQLKHKHVPEMQVHGGLTHPPIFTPAVGRYYKGMLVQVPLHLWSLPGRPSSAALHAALSAHFEGSTFVSVAPLAESAGLADLDPEALNDTNRLRLYVFGHDGAGQALLVACLDNLGKGASGAAVQNLNIMLGRPAGLGL